MTVCYYHVMYAFQSKSTLYSSLNMKELVAWYRRDIWSLSESIEIRTHKHLVYKWLLNHLANLDSLGKWLSVRLRTKCLWFHFPLLSFILLVILKTYQFYSLTALKAIFQEVYRWCFKLHIHIAINIEIKTIFLSFRCC